MTAINGRIRRLLAALPAVSYVGYTATPFANVLISPYAESGDGLDDLYPRDFITALPTPTSYFGPEMLFGCSPVNANRPEPLEEGLDMIRTIPKDHIHLLQPRNRKSKDNFSPEMCASLQGALMYFYASCAARRARGHANQHMTMLVHTSPYVIVHERLADLIYGWTQQHREELLDRTSILGIRVEEIWKGEQERIHDRITDAARVAAADVFENLASVLSALEVPVENGSSNDRIDYSGPEARIYVVVGGSILSRGLTLEGLMVSYFLRSTSQYDTLLQMGRWFGFRPGYEDLPRIWTTEDLAFKFRDLAAIEQEVRDEIKEYRRQRKSPMEIAVRIRAIPGMVITASNKMRAARNCSVSFWGTHRQTFRFEHRNVDLLKENWTAASRLIEDAEQGILRVGNVDRLLWCGVPRDAVLRFFTGYRAHPTHVDLQNSVLVPFLESDDHRLDVWNVGIVQPRANRLSGDNLGCAGRVHLVTRARLPGSQEFADIKALMSRGDLWFDCRAEFPLRGGWQELKIKRTEIVGQRPLLLLYAVDRVSRPRDSQYGRRVPLDAVRDVLAYGVVFPGSITEAAEHVSVVLRPQWAEDPEEIAELEKAQAEVADVI